MKLGRVFAAAILLSCIPAFAASGSFQLKIFEGYNFATRTVGKSDAADLSFTYQVRRTGMISYLSAAKIKDFSSPPSGLSAAQVNSWEDYVAGPSPAYYVIRTKDGRHYLLHLKTYENQGKAASYWVMTFDWQDFSLGGNQATTQPVRQPQPDLPPIAPPSNTSPSKGGTPVGDGFLTDTGRRDPTEGLQDRVVLDFTVQTSLTVGWRGQVYGVSVYRAGTNSSGRTSIFDSKGWASISVSSGKYDIWVLSGDDRMKFIRTVDVTSLKPGNVYAATLRVENFDTKLEDMRNGRVKPPSTSDSQPPSQSPSTTPSRTPTAGNSSDRESLRRSLLALQDEQERSIRAQRSKIQALQEEYESRISALRRQMQADDEAFEAKIKEIRLRIQQIDEQSERRDRERIRQ